MYSSWVEAYQEDKVTAVVLLDMSAAFDLVDKSILIEKLKLYGLDGKSSSWMESYMSERSQRVYIDGDLSEAMTVEVGVPQGSILGPILYCLFSASFKTRKRVANGVVILRIIYVIQLWGGTSDFMIKMLQVWQNKGARFFKQNDIFQARNNCSAGRA